MNREDIIPGSFGSLSTQKISSTHVGEIFCNGLNHSESFSPINTDPTKEINVHRNKTIHYTMGENIDSENEVITENMKLTEESLLATSSGNENMDFVEAEFIDSAVSPFPSDCDKNGHYNEGTLDHFFTEDFDDHNFFINLQENNDFMNHCKSEDKAIWSVYDLYTVLELISVSKRIEADTKSISGCYGGIKSATITDTDHVEYCSASAANRDLQHDLYRITGLKKNNDVFTERIFALLGTGFTDPSVDVRGYESLKSMLNFHESKQKTLNIDIESRENYVRNTEGIQSLRDTINSEWNELSGPDERWEFERSVNKIQSDSIHDGISVRENNESEEAFIQRCKDEWGALVLVTDDEV